MADQGLDFGMDDHGRWTIEPLAKPEVIEGHSVEDLERIAAGGQPTAPTTPAPTTVQPLSQQPAQQQAPAQATPSSDVAALQQQVTQLTQLVGLMAQDKLAALNQNGNGHQSPATPSMRDQIAKQLEEANGDPEMQADILMRAMDQREQQLRSQIERDYSLSDVKLQSDLGRLYKQYGEDFKALLPAIELIHRSDSTIPLEQAYLGIKQTLGTLGITGAPNNAPGGANPSQPTVQKPILSSEEARALLAKRDLMRTESGMNGTEARPSNVKKSFGEMLHDNMAQARKQGRAGG